jgi:hypothetical protein
MRVPTEVKVMHAIEEKNEDVERRACNKYPTHETESCEA